MPFGGMNASGFGKDMGPEQLDSYLSTKSVYVQIGSSGGMASMQGEAKHG
jgi:acyl-CoA reductase-like NAD-dependent aldehyde dehydrogenase